FASPAESPGLLLCAPGGLRVARDLLSRHIMLLAKIVGTVVATRKDPRLVSSKLLVVRPMDPRGKADGNYLVAVDTVDAGVGETVLVVSGSSARMASGLKDCPVDAAIIGIIDEIDIKD